MWCYQSLVINQSLAKPAGGSQSSNQVSRIPPPGTMIVLIEILLSDTGLIWTNAYICITDNMQLFGILQAICSCPLHWYEQGVTGTFVFLQVKNQNSRSITAEY